MKYISKEGDVSLQLLGLLFTLVFAFFAINNPIAADSREVTQHNLYLPFVNSGITRDLGPIYGVNFISSAEDPADDLQYANGKATGATFNRWPIYWYNVEQSEGEYNWQNQDRVVLDDISNGFRTNAILLGTPAFYHTTVFDTSDLTRPPQRGMFSLMSIQAAAPEGLYAPIFEDGTDIPGPEKIINPDNVWARFVFAAVNRYKPGGILAQNHQLDDDQGIRHWEMWNEPDLSWFWDSSLEEYARLLKVGYLSAKQADPQANILFGALANNFEKLDYYKDVLQIFAGEPDSDSHHYYHDILATHSYFYAWQSWYHVFRASETMEEFNLSKPIWLNETGVPAWNDYPGPVWDPDSDYRATTTEQAHYTIQTAFYAIFAGADAIFHFQLYDGCGNQPRGTDFPPHNGELCDGNRICAGDANGLFRNPTDAACFTQHPNPETPRANFQAYKVLTKYLTDVEPLWRKRPGGSTPYDGPQEWIAYYQPKSGKRIIGLWSRVGSDQVASIEATDLAALVVFPNGTTEVIRPVEGYYELVLPGATNQNAPWDPTLFAIGGEPLILIERYLPLFDTPRQ